MLSLFVEQFHPLVVWYVIFAGAPWWYLVYGICGVHMLSSQVLHGGNDSLCMLAGSHLLISECHHHRHLHHQHHHHWHHRQNVHHDHCCYFFADQSSSENKRLKVFPTASHHLILEVSTCLKCWWEWGFSQFNLKVGGTRRGCQKPFTESFRKGGSF